jgi:catechol 2,3-dioxygenase-like lactoylglutathione lyase family enzyme
MHLTQVTLPAVDLGLTVDFYRRLGLRQIVEDLARYARFELPDGNGTRSIEQVSDPVAGHGPVVYFECEDLDQTVRQLRAMGIRFDGLPIDQPWLSR